MAGHQDHEHSTHGHTTHGLGDHAAPHDHHGASHGPDMGYPAELLDLDAEVNGRYLNESLDHIAAALGRSPRHIVDLGAGTGVGTLALAQRFPDAQITALDASGELLARLTARAEHLGDRVHGRVVDLDAPWPELPPTDIVWASSSIHHLTHPVAVFEKALSVLAPGGVLAVVEIAEQPRFLSVTDLAGAGFEDRLHSVLDFHPPMDWRADIGAAGFGDIAVHQLITDLDPAPEGAVGYARAFFGAAADRLSGRDPVLSAEDAALLESLRDVDAERIVLRSARTLWLARRDATAAG